MDWTESQNVREYLKDRALALMKHEKKEYATVGVLDENIESYAIEDRRFYVVKSNIFKYLLETFYLKAQEKFPKKFGTGDAKDVIEALHAVRPFFEISQYIELLKNEQFAYLFEYVNGSFSDKVLRIDLFRRLDKNEKGQLQFTGGIMHAFKHFSVNGVNLTTGKDINEVQHPVNVVSLVIQAFFLQEGLHETMEKMTSMLPIDERCALKFVFYLEKQTGTYFIKTIHKCTLV